MKLFCCFTPAHRLLFDRYFQPSLPAAFELHATNIEVAGRGDYYSSEFLECIRRKMALVVESVAANPGELIVWTDIDIVFLENPLEELRRIAAASPADLFLQREGRRIESVNTGFMLIRCTPEALAFFQELQRRLASETHKNEQAVANDLLFIDHFPVRWEYLPLSFYARTHGWPPPQRVFLYHANFTVGPDGIGQKIRQFEELAWVRKWGGPARLYSVVKRVPGKLWRMVVGDTRGELKVVRGGSGPSPAPGV